LSAFFYQLKYDQSDCALSLEVEEKNKLKGILVNNGSTEENAFTNKNIHMK
jgi:hypothetical protein